MRCQDFRDVADLYVDGELSLETISAVVVHLENCPDCRVEVAQLQTLRSRVTAAAVNAPEYQVDSAFVARLRKQFADKPPCVPLKKKWRDTFALRHVVLAGASAAVLLLIAYAMIPIKLPIIDSVSVPADLSGSPAVQGAAPEDVRPTNIVWRETVNNAVKEHDNCTLKNLTIQHSESVHGPSALAFGPKFDEVVRGALERETKKKMTTVANHVCDSDGREYMHLIYKHGERFVSVMITESAGYEGNDNAIFCETINGYQVACFKARHRTVFVISDFPEPENVKIAREITPDVRSFLLSSSPAL